jgi:hypothetical protein
MGILLLFANDAAQREERIHSAEGVENAVICVNLYPKLVTMPMILVLAI